STLSGNGTILGNLTIDTGATISPGNSIGTINVANYTQNAGTFYIVEVDSAGHADLIKASGTATLNGGTVVTDTTLGFLPNFRYVIVNAQGGVTGQFAGVTSAAGGNPALFTTRLLYDPNNVYLIFQTNIANVAARCNQGPVARQFDSILLT